jgi:hypothetical protein
MLEVLDIMDIMDMHNTANRIMVGLVLDGSLLHTAVLPCVPPLGATLVVMAHDGTSSRWLVIHQTWKVNVACNLGDATNLRCVDLTVVKA